jgi:hypothetical protein
MSRELLRTVAWRPVSWGGSDVASLFRLDDGWEVAGVSDLEVDLSDMEPGPGGQPPPPLVRIRLDYATIMDERWQTRTVRLQMVSGPPTKRQSCTLGVGKGGTWKHKSGNMVPELWFLEGIYQFTLDITPAMRVQQVRSMALEVGQEQEIEAVSLNLPDFSADPVSVLMRRTGETSYECLETNGGMSLESHITVDDLGLVVNQEGTWTRSGESGPFTSS